MKVRNKNELQAKLDQIAAVALAETAAAVKNLWRELIEDRFYSLYTPKVYRRTFQLLDSVVITGMVKSGNRRLLNVFMDTETAVQGYKYDLPEYVWGIAAEGMHGGAGIQTEGRFYDELTAVLADGRLADEFERALKKMGLKLTRKQ